ncbi:MAG: hypothetical protein ABW252_03780 [Polyangiales bacterium]
MFDSATLEVVIGMTFLFLLVSIVCTAVREGLESLLKTRAAYLEQGIREMLNDREGTNLARALFEHPLIGSLYFGAYRPGPRKRSVLARGFDLPSYIPARNFAAALLDIVLRGEETDAESRPDGHTPAAMRAQIMRVDNDAVRRLLLAIMHDAKANPTAMRAHLESWFDTAMDRVSGWYKRSTQWITLTVALSAAIALNIDAIGVAQFLYRNDAARAALVTRAETSAHAPAAPAKTATEARATLASLDLPIGWQAAPPLTEKGFAGYATRGLGWLLTTFAAMLGAPFWFDMLNRIMVIRATVKPHQKSPEEASQDRQPPSPVAAPTVTLAASAPPLHAADAAALRAQAPDNDVDPCDVLADGDTPDEHLPPAFGGVRA